MRDFLRYYPGPLTLPRVILWVLTAAFLAFPCYILHLGGEPWYYGLGMVAGVGAFYCLVYWVAVSLMDEKHPPPP